MRGRIRRGILRSDRQMLKVHVKEIRPGIFSNIFGNMHNLGNAKEAEELVVSQRIEVDLIERIPDPRVWMMYSPPMTPAT